jgi:hypothetical protein
MPQPILDREMHNLALRSANGAIVFVELDVEGGLEQAV